MADRMPLLRPRFAAASDGVGARLTLLLATLSIIDLLGVLPIIVLPRTIAECGWLGIPLTLLVFTLQIYTALLLGRCWIIAETLHPDIVYDSRYPYAALAELSYGRKFGKFVTILLDLHIFGNAVPDLIVAAENLQLLGLKSSSWEFDFSFCYWTIVLGICLCPITWLGTPRDTKWVTTLSVMLVVSSTLLVWACLVASGGEWRPVPLPDPAWDSVAIAYGVLAFQFDVHPLILSVQMEMDRKDHIGYAILGAFFVTGGLSLATTGVVLARFGGAARANLLQGFASSPQLYLALLLSTAQLCLALVLSAARCFGDIEDKLGMPQGFGWQRALLRTALVGLAVLAAEGVPRFDLLMGLVGGALTGPLMLLLPPLVYARLRTLQDQARRVPAPDYTATDDSVDETLPPSLPPVGAAESGLLRATACRLLSLEGASDEGPLSIWETLLVSSVVVAGIAASLAATYFSMRDSINIAPFSPPCLQ
ncbi:amino acid transporter AVT1B [Schistocerca americana]|uniref:amino acid transporter AVT1B n=1 Tax=Schistocerca americana TaxID=7009 RepID=UPI001F5009E3|nr:amino acid transporter AVT1B [Schistocerca americana]